MKTLSLFFSMLSFNCHYDEKLVKEAIWITFDILDQFQKFSFDAAFIHNQKYMNYHKIKVHFL